MQHDDQTEDYASISENTVVENFDNTSTNLALLNDLVLDRIIQFLSFDSFLNFRLVCRKWFSCSENAFWKRSRICYEVLTYLHPSTWNDSTWSAVNYKNEEQMHKFCDTFPLAELPSTSIKFQGYVNEFSLDNILRYKGSTIEEIYFKAIYHRQSKKIIISIDPYLGPNITKLDVRDTLSTWFFVSLEKLMNIKYLYLDNHCSIILNGKITPKEISIVCDSNNQMLIYNGKSIREWNLRANLGLVLINEFVDFSEIRKLHLKGRIFKLNIAEFSPKLEVLELIDRVVVEGWNYTQWQTNHFKNDLLDFSAHSQMMLKSIVKVTESMNYYNELDFTALPHFIERLSFTRYWHESIWTFLYPNLKYVYIGQNMTHRESLSAGPLDFAMCTNLEDVELNSLNSRTKYVQNLKLIKLPSSVRRMKLHSANIESSFVYRLDVLVLVDYSQKLAETMISHFETNKLVLEYNEELLYDEEKISAINFWKGRGIPVFAIKGFKWTEVTSFIGSEFSRYVDAEGTCYIFYRGEPGKAIDLKTFEGLCTL